MLKLKATIKRYSLFIIVNLDVFKAINRLAKNITTRWLKLLSGCFPITTFLCLLIIVPDGLIAQDPHFSQFYAHPLNLNPALAGTGECGRIMAGFRNQWPGIDQTYTTASLEADRYFDALSGGVGITVLNDDAAGLINTLRVGGIYAYHLKISGEASLNAGFEATYHQQRINWNDLIFNDMIDISSGNVSSGAEVPPTDTRVSAVDFSTGLLFGISKKYYLGVAAHHLTEPDLSYYSSDVAALYRTYTLHGGAHFILVESYYPNRKGELSLNPNVLYQQQKNAQQLNLGLNLSYHPFTLGIWYRHNFSNPDAMIGFIGLNHKYFNFGYSYDFTMSGLKGESGGAHEVTVALLFGCEGKRKKPGAIKCPEF